MNIIFLSIVSQMALSPYVKIIGRHDEAINHYSHLLNHAIFKQKSIHSNTDNDQDDINDNSGWQPT